MINLKTLTVTKAHEHLKNGDFTVAELCDTYIFSIKEKDKDVHAFLEVFDDIPDQCRRAQQMFADGTATALTGIPVAVKDNILIKGKRVSAASKILEGYVAPYSATAIKKLRDAGAVFIGRTNMDEFAMGSSTENSAFGQTKNPHDLTRVPGGSSGGSAAAIAMDGALVALGSDTAGSVRQPAAFCGCVGLKTTYGSISRNGLIALGSSLDQIGPLTKTVTDAELVFNALRGHDPLDSTTIPHDAYAAARGSDAQQEKAKHKKLTIGVTRSLVMGEGIDADVRANFEESIKKLESLGYTIKDIELPHAKYSLPAYYIMLPGEASSNLARFDGMKYGLYKSGDKLIDDYLETRGQGFGPEPRRRILLGTYVLSSGYYDAYYNKSQQARKLIGQDFTRAWEDVDVIMMPTTPTPAFKLGEKLHDPVSMYLADVFTVPSNIAGIPTISVPSGFAARDGVDLPLGMQFVAPHCREDLLFSVGKDFLGE